MTEIYNIDYTQHVELVGTAHFTKRSINDAYNAIKNKKHEDVALELDWRRYKKLDTMCQRCWKHRSCEKICEFVAATDAMENVDTNIWLIDMTEEEIRRRIANNLTPYERSRGRHPYMRIYEDTIKLWEMGFKDRVIQNSKRQIERNRKFRPTVWKVLIDERNVLMAARLACIVSKNVSEKVKSKILTFVGAAHVEGIKKYLEDPLLIKNDLKRYDLKYTEPFLIRRVSIENAA
jgi:pheromone shutdown protein TraB